MTPELTQKLKRSIDVGKSDRTREKITLLERSLEQDDRNPAYFKHMLNNSLAHHLVKVEWFEGQLNEI